MAERLPQLYDVTYLDAEGEVIRDQKFVVQYEAGEAPVEREVRFQEIGSELGAADYSVRFMRPAEVRKYRRDISREQFGRQLRDTIMKKILRTDIDDLTRLVRIMSGPDIATSDTN